MLQGNVDVIVEREQLRLFFDNLCGAWGLAGGGVVAGCKQRVLCGVRHGPAAAHSPRSWCSKRHLLMFSARPSLPSAGPVSRIRLLGDTQHSSKIAFVEFVTAESARGVLKLSGALLGAFP